MALLELTDVRAGYGAGPDILNGVTLTIEEGATCSILGPNGAGKSTLLKAIAGLLRLRGGEIVFDGKPLSGLRPDQVLRRGVCFVPQDRSLFPDMTVRENLVMSGFLLDDRRALAERQKEVYELFPILAERRGQRARTMSGGQQQMLALARAWILKPRLLLVDEPSMGLAPQVIGQIFDVIRRFRDAGMTVMLVEHNVDHALACSDRGIVMDLGRARLDDAADTILAHPEVRELYLGKRMTKRALEAR